MTARLDPATVIAESVGPYTLPGRRYHSPLPADLAPWYVYVVDSGHCILITLSDSPDMAVPAAVKTVLRQGWTVLPNGMIHADLTYDDALGLITPPGDDEYGDTLDTSKG